MKTRLPAKNTKDRLRQHAKENGSVKVAVPTVSRQLSKPPLAEFEIWTHHLNEIEPTKFTVFRDGEHEPPLSVSAERWAGPFTGRPELIAELLPILTSELAGKSLKTVRSAQTALRSWWRLLDSVEKEGAATIRSARDFTDLHRQRAFDTGMPSGLFTWFINRLINPTRAALRALGNTEIKHLHWIGPERETGRMVKNALPEVEVVDPIRMALKHGWFAALHRWERTEALMLLGRPRTSLEAGFSEEARLDEVGRSRDESRREEEARLLKQYEQYSRASQRINGRVPCSKLEAKAGLTENEYVKAGYNLMEMQRGFYPDGDDIRMAFMLCLAATGWNPQTLLDLDATKSEEFIVEHPRNDPNDKKGHQYLMKAQSENEDDSFAEVDEEDTVYSMGGWKERAKHEVYTEGLKKSRASAPVIVLTLIERTAALREKLRGDLTVLTAHYQERKSQGGGLKELQKAHKEIVQLQKRLRSPWLYFALGSVQSLNEENFDASSKGRWLRHLITSINAVRPIDRQVPYIVATDFRKIFGNYWYRMSHGNILHVQKALGHAAVRTTQGYLQNNVVQNQNNKNWSTFLQHFWEAVETGSVDPTVLAKLCNDGNMSAGELGLLVDYRALERSRIGVPCLDPHNPPRDLDPTFVPDGESKCVAQRCTLCQSNAVLAPDSWPGLCMRIAELRHLQEKLPMEVFSTVGSFGIELQNTERALLAFPDQPVEKHIELWVQRIADGEHVPPEFI